MCHNITQLEQLQMFISGHNMTVLGNWDKADLDEYIRITNTVESHN